MRMGILVFILSTTTQAWALGIEAKVERAYLQAGGSAKALSHAKCFLANFAQETFQLKKASMGDRCNGMSHNKQQIDINNFDQMVIVDFTQKSSQRRMYVIDLNNPQSPYVHRYYVAHGKYKAKTYDNSVLAPFENSVAVSDYFSNTSGSNASSTGFYITGHLYQGSWVGPKGDKFSMILHGISKDSNDNACDRAVVMHGNSAVNESGPNEGVIRMSAGCFMLDYEVVNQLVAQLRGGGGSHYPNENRLGGVLMFAYGNAEAALPSNYYCTPASTSSLRL